MASIDIPLDINGLQVYKMPLHSVLEMYMHPVHARVISNVILRVVARATSLPREGVVSFPDHTKARTRLAEGLVQKQYSGRNLKQVNTRVT